jgi:hypothetical protein
MSKNTVARDKEKACVFKIAKQAQIDQTAQNKEPPAPPPFDAFAKNVVKKY